MPRETDFRTVRCQASLFTTELQFSVAKVFAHFLTKYGSQFDGDPVSLPSAQGFPPEIPRITLKSADNKLHLQAGPTRLDVIREEDAISNSAMAEFFQWAAQIGVDYLQKNRAKAGRIACVLQRVASDPNPAKTLSQHFCQQKWLDKPLNRPGHFELHAQKQFRLDSLFDVNSWVRCKTAILTKPGQPPATAPDLILVEQDVNSLAEQMDVREMSMDEIRQFFEFAPQEMHRTLSLYFPSNNG